MIETLSGVDIFFIIMALSVAVATTIGALIGWHVFGIARDARRVVRAVAEEGEAVVHEVATAARTVVEREMASGAGSSRRSKKRVSG